LKKEQSLVFSFLFCFKKISWHGKVIKGWDSSYP
jgi:hypothetical protein